MCIENKGAVKKKKAGFLMIGLTPHNNLVIALMVGLKRISVLAIQSV